MKFYQPNFSFLIIIIQSILSLISYYHFEKWEIENPELDKFICRAFNGGTLFLFILIIGLYEILIKPSWLKSIIRIFLVCLVLGTNFSEYIPIKDFYYGVYNTAWFSTFIALGLILVKIGKIIYKKGNKASR